VGKEEKEVEGTLSDFKIDMKSLSSLARE